MKPTATQIVLVYVASISLMLTAFHRRLGLADYWEYVFMSICVVALIGFSLSRKRQKAALAGIAPGGRSKPNRKIMWLGLILIMAPRYRLSYDFPASVSLPHTRSSSRFRSARLFYLSWHISSHGNVARGLTNRAAAMRRFSFMRQVSEFAVLASASGGSALSR